MIVPASVGPDILREGPPLPALGDRLAAPDRGRVGTVGDGTDTALDQSLDE
jgi:hypothetical protein